MVVMANRPQFLPPEGSAIRAANRGNTQNSPKKQWKVRSPKNSLLQARMSMRMICRTADGMDNRLLLKVEKPMRLRVRERYA